MRTEPIAAAHPAGAEGGRGAAPRAAESAFRTRLSRVMAGGPSRHEPRDGGAAAHAPPGGSSRPGRVGGADAAPPDREETLRAPRSGPKRRGDEEPAVAEPARFWAPPAVLSPTATGGAASGSGGAVPNAELAALAERFLTSFRVGRLADGSSVLRLRVDGRGRGDLEVELRGTSGGLVAVVGASDGDRRRASDWAERLEAALRARGLDVGAVEVG